MTSARDFPEGFLVGAASAAYQVEGASSSAERGPVLWDRFLADGKGFRGDTGAIAADHIRHLDEDLELLAKLGVDSYRFSISWARVMPDGRAPSAGGLDFYERLVDGLLERGIVPMATLYHMDVPAAFPGGWAERDTSLAFADYAGHVVGRLGDRIPLWATVNEPYFEAWLSHYDGSWPPGGRKLADAFAGLHHMLLGHGLAIAAARAAAPRAIEIGIVNSYSPCVPGSERDEDVRATDLALAHTNRFVLDAVLRGSYPDEVIAYHAEHGSVQAVHDGDLAAISTPIDYLGLNYYQLRHVVAADHRQPATRTVPEGYELRYLTDLGIAETVPADAELSAMGQPISPDGLTQALLEVTERYGPIPIRVTECGLALHDYVDPEGRVNDERRVRFLERHLDATLAAIDAGADVRGFYVWGLLDNLEWNLGYEPRFGLVFVDFPSQTRYPKKSFEWLRALLQERAVASPE